MGQTRVKNDNTNYVINSKSSHHASELRKAALSREFNNVIVLDSRKTCITTVKSNLPDLRAFAKQFRSTCKTLKNQLPDTYMSHCNQTMSVDHRYVHENYCERCIENKRGGEVKRKAGVKINQEAYDINERNRLSEVTTTEVTDHRLNKEETDNYRDSTAATIGRPRKYSLEEKQNTLNVLKRTNSITKTCEITGISRRAVSHWRNDYLLNKESTKNYRYSPEEKKLVEDLLHENLGNIPLTCLMTGVDDNTMNRWVYKGEVKQYEGKDAYVKSNRGNEYDFKDKQKAIGMYHEIGSIHEVSKATGIPDSTLHAWIPAETKYEKLSVEELDDKYEYHMGQADMIDKIKTEKESKRNESLEKISQLEDFLKTGMEQLAQLKQEIE